MRKLGKNVGLKLCKVYNLNLYRLLNWYDIIAWPGQLDNVVEKNELIFLCKYDLRTLLMFYLIKNMHFYVKRYIFSLTQYCHIYYLMPS